MPTSDSDELLVVAQLLAQIFGLHSSLVSPPIRIFPVDGNPNARLVGSPSDIAISRNPVGVWQKQTGVETDSGWTQLGTGGGGASGDFTPNGLRLVGTSGQGAVDTAVLLFTTAPATGDFGLPTNDWLVQTNDPNFGSTFQIIKQGNYEVTLDVPTNSAAPGDAPFVGITLDATGALLTAPPIFGVFPEVQGGTSEQDASLPSSLFCSAPIPIPQQEIDAGRGVIRFQNTPGAPLVNGLVGIIIRRVGPCILP